jgi:hypothetical protein
MAERLIDRLNGLKSWQVALIFLGVALAVFSTGLFNDWQDDDLAQIVNNTAIQDLGGIPQLFVSGTYPDETGALATDGSPKLIGAYYRPLMMSCFAIIYAVAGPLPFAFHFIQLLLIALAALGFYLFLKMFIRPPSLAFGLALIFLIHPVNSQNAFAIACLQEPLLFISGILALWILARYNSVRSLALAAGLLFLSLLSKETAVVFIAIALLYLLMFKRQQLLKFVGLLAGPVALYLFVKLSAVGVGYNHVTAIDYLPLATRLLNGPDIIWLYLGTFLYPLSLAYRYYGTVLDLSLVHFWLPLAADVAIVALSVAGGRMIKRAIKPKFKSKKQLPDQLPDRFKTYLFFGAWAVLGMLPNLQLMPLDSTADLSWMYITTAGLLGMLGIWLSVLWSKLNPSKVVLVSVAVFVLLAVRTGVRGLDWQSPYTLAEVDVKVAPANNNFAHNALVRKYLESGDYAQALEHERQSIAAFPNVGAYQAMVYTQLKLHDCEAARKASASAKMFSFYNEMKVREAAILTLCSGESASNIEDIKSVSTENPNVYQLWIALAVAEQKNNDNAAAKEAISNASRLRQPPANIYDGIMNNQPFSFHSEEGDFDVKVPAADPK